MIRKRNVDKDTAAGGSSDRSTAKKGPEVKQNPKPSKPVQKRLALLDFFCNPKRLGLILAGTLLSLVSSVTLTHFFVTSPIKAVSFTLPPPAHLVNELAVNDVLTSATKYLDGQIYGPESIAVHPITKKIYTGLKTGLICEIAIDEEKNTAKILRSVRLTKHEDCFGRYDDGPLCGRPLGLRFNLVGNLVVVDAYLGVYVINLKSEKVQQIVAGGAEVSGGKKSAIRYLNDVDFLPDGKLVLSESSNKFDDRDCLLDVLEHRPNGRLLTYDPATGDIEVLVDNLYFPNGVYSYKEDIIFSEMGMSRLMRYSMPTKKLSVVLDLPGYPDNIRGRGDHIWLAIPQLRNADDDWLAAKPQYREMITKMFSPLAIEYLVSWTSPAYGLVVKIDLKTNKVVQSLHDPLGNVAAITSAVEDGHGNLLLGNDADTYFARIEIPEIKKTK